MKKIRVETDSPYHVLLGQELLEDCGELILEVHKPSGAVVVTDDVVAPLYLHTVKSSLQKAGFRVLAFVFANGEESKNGDTLAQMLHFFGEKHLDRGDLVVALGGGVVGDIAGFAAGIYKRGVPYVQLPTTLLAQIDSSVGGKTAVNTSLGKNMVGLFHQPKLVLCDVGTLHTLPAEIFHDGVAEAVKYAAIGSSKLFSLLEAGAKENLTEIIEACIAMKADIVKQDAEDKGVRQLLNFGHTFGHAVERCSDFGVSHGRAVAIGMVLVCEYLQRQGELELSEVSRLKALLEKYNLPTETSIARENLIEVAKGDKKRAGENITFVFIKKIGEGYLESVPLGELENMVF